MEADPPSRPATARGPAAWWREPTRPQWIAFLAAWAGWVLDGFDFTVFLLVMPEIAREFGVTWVATAGSITLTLLLRLVGGAAAGWLADRHGRKLPLMISIAWFAACDGAVAFAPTFGWVLALRALFGLGMGAEWTAGATLAMESWPERTRGLASGVLQGSWAIGYILAALVSAAIVPTHGWRALFLLAAAPALLVLPIRLWVQESPDWRRAREAGAGHALPSLRGRGVPGRIAWASLWLAAAFGIYYGQTGLWPALLRTSLGLSPAEVARQVVVFNLGMLAGAVAWGWLAVRRGVGIALFTPLVLLLATVPLYVGAVPGWLGVGAFAGGAFGAGMTGVTPHLLALLFPADVRARCIGLVYHAGAMLAAATPTLVALLAEGGRMPLARAMGLVIAGAALLTAAALAVRPRA